MTSTAIDSPAFMEVGLITRPAPPEYRRADPAPARTPDAAVAGGGADDSTHEALDADRLMSLISSTADVLLVYDATGVLQWASPSLGQVFGWCPREMVGQRFFLSQLHDLDEANVESPWEQWCAVTSPSWIQRRQTVRGDGRSGWVEEAVTMVRDHEGVVTAAVVSARDITAHMHATQALAESEAHFRAVAERASEVTYHGDPEGVLNWVSDGVLEALGVDSATVCDRAMSRWVDPADVPLWEAALLAARGGQAHNVRVRLCGANGSRSLWEISVHPVTGPDHEVVGVAGGWRNVDAATSREALLEASEQHLYGVAHAAGDLVVEVADDGVIRWVSVGGQALLGRSEDELVGADLSEVLHIDSPPLRDVVAPGSGRGSFTGWALRANGSRVAVHIVCRGVQPSGASEVDRRRSWVLSVHEVVIGDRKDCAVPSEIRATVRLSRGRVQWVSPSLTALLGWGPDEWIGQRLSDFVHPDDRDAVSGTLIDSAPDERDGLLIRVVDLDGGHAWVNLTTARMRRSDGQVTQVVAVLASSQVAPA